MAPPAPTPWKYSYSLIYLEAASSSLGKATWVSWRSSKALERALASITILLATSKLSPSLSLSLLNLSPQKLARFCSHSRFRSCNYLAICGVKVYAILKNFNHNKQPQRWNFLCVEHTWTPCCGWTTARVVLQVGQVTTLPKGTCTQSLKPCMWDA